MVVARSSCDILEEAFLKKFSFQPVPGVKYRNNYVLLCEDMNALIEKDDASGLIRLMRIAAEDDLFFLLYFILDCSYRDWETDRKSTRLNSSHSAKSRMPSSA